jgi:hypothetical protein
LRQPGVGYVPTSSCMVLDPPGAQAVRRSGHLSERDCEDVLGESSSYILNFNYFWLCCIILILSCTQEHFRLTESVSEKWLTFSSIMMRVK